MIGKLTTIIGFLREFFSFFNNFAIPQAIKHIYTALQSSNYLDDAVNTTNIFSESLLYSFIGGILGLTVIKLILNR